MTFIKPSFVLLQRSNEDIINDIDWYLHSSKPYVIRNPINPDELMYMDYDQYMALMPSFIAAKRTIVQLAGPQDTPQTIASRFRHNIGNSSTQKSSPLLKSKIGHRLFRLVSGWNLSGNRVKIERNFDLLLPTFYLNLVSWQGLVSKADNLKDIWKLSKALNRIFKTRGIKHTLVRLKVYLFVVNNYVAGNRMVTTQPLGLRVDLTNGLPTCIPPRLRHLIRVGNPQWIRIISSLFFSYKGIEGVYDSPDLSTIQAEAFERSDWSEVRTFSQTFWGWYNWKHHDLGHYVLESLKYQAQVILSAGPNKSISLLGCLADAYYWVYCCKWEETPVYKILRYMGYYGYLALIESAALEYRDTNPSANSHKLRSSKLSLIYEAAGKIRIIAICDYWSQCILRPFHDFMFSVLKDIPMDATFDQEGAVKKFAAKGYKNIYSFDLKSATDLIPQRLYIEVFSSIFGEKLSTLWMDLLVNRDFYYRDTRDKVEYTNIRYTRGQPMGAYSSWASLALVHHFVVQLSAFRVGIDRFQDYLVLGDDIVIANKEVADSYLQVCKDYGIVVGLPKSFISNKGFFQFASQNIWGQTNISPVSLREIINANDLSSRIEFSLRLARRGMIDISPVSLLRANTDYIGWKYISESFSKGIIPSETVPILVALLGHSNYKSLSQKSVDYGAVLAFIKRKYQAVLNQPSDLNPQRLIHNMFMLLYKMIDNNLDTIRNNYVCIKSKVENDSIDLGSPCINSIVQMHFGHIASVDMKSGEVIFNEISELRRLFSHPQAPRSAILSRMYELLSKTTNTLDTLTLIERLVESKGARKVNEWNSIFLHITKNSLDYTLREGNKSKAPIAW